MMMFDMAKMMNQAKKMQDKMTQIQEELANTTMEGESSDGKVKVSCTGKFENWNVEIASGMDSKAVEPLMKEALEDLANNIMNQTQSKMSELTKGMNIPGLKLPGMG